MRFIVIDKKTGISVQHHYDRESAEKQAEKMTDYHQELFIVKEEK